MGIIFIIGFFAIIIYISNLEDKKCNTEREKLYLEKNYLFLKYKNEYSRLSEKSLKKICEELNEEYSNKYEFCYNCLKKSGIKNGMDEYIFRPESSFPYQFVVLKVRDSYPELFYKYNCAKWILDGYELGDDRVDFEIWLYDSAGIYDWNFFGYYFG